VYPHIARREAEGEFRAFMAELRGYDIDAPLEDAGALAEAAAPAPAAAPCAALPADQIDDAARVGDCGGCE